LHPGIGDTQSLVVLPLVGLEHDLQADLRIGLALDLAFRPKRDTPDRQSFTHLLE